MSLPQQGRTSIIAMFVGGVALIGLGIYIGLRPLPPLLDSQQRQETEGADEAETDQGSEETDQESGEKESGTEDSDVKTYSYGETGDGVNDHGACDADADLYCPDQVAGKSVQASYKIDLVNCLYENETKLTSDCLASLDRRVAINEQVSESCAVERGSLCAGVVPMPGSEPMMDCLWENQTELSAECLAAITAHDCAKPIDQVKYCGKEN